LPRKKHYRKGEEREKEERGWVVVPKHETVAKPLKDRQTVTLALLCILLPVSFKSRGDREGGEGGGRREGLLGDTGFGCRSAR